MHMLDKKVVPIIKPALRKLAQAVNKLGFSANQVTVIGFCIGVLAVVCIALNEPLLGLLFLLLNRLADGIDGELARLKTPTDAGAFLDISLDFIFYALVPVGFAFANPTQNALPAAVLIASFVGTGASFLAFSSMASKHELAHPNFAYKGLYYLDGLAEGTETIICFALMCLLPHYFHIIAGLFAVVCIVTALNRVVFGYLTLRDRHK